MVYFFIFKKVILNLSLYFSPAGSIARNSPAARYLAAKGYFIFQFFFMCLFNLCFFFSLTPRDFNSYGARRGNDDVMARGTFANIRMSRKIFVFLKRIILFNFFFIWLQELLIN